jgi:hypothetical protein
MPLLAAGKRVAPAAFLKRRAAAGAQDRVAVVAVVAAWRILAGHRPVVVGLALPAAAPPSADGVWSLIP